MNKIKNQRELLAYLKKHIPEFQIIDKPSTTGKTKYNNLAKQYSKVIVIDGGKQ